VLLSPSSPLLMMPNPLPFPNLSSNAANVTEILSHVWKLSGGGAATVLHCTQVAGLEGTAILAAKSVRDVSLAAFRVLGE